MHTRVIWATRSCVRSKLWFLVATVLMCCSDYFFVLPVIARVSSTITRPWYRIWRGKAHAAQLSAQQPPKGQKRISKDKRRVMIDEFVECYKTLNDGKFPTIRIVRQHVGGSHYTVREILQEVKYNHTKLPLDNSKAAQLQEMAECAEQQRSEEDNRSNSFNPQSFKGKLSVDDALLSQKGYATGTVTMEKTGTWRSLELKTQPDSSNYSGETEAAKQVLYTEDTFMNANDSAVSGQTETEGMKTEASISLGLETKSDSGSHRVETEANKLHLNSMGKFQNASEPTVADHTENDKVIKENVLDREENPEVEHQGTTKTSLLGSLKYFASGIRNFWKKL